MLLEQTIHTKCANSFIDYRKLGYVPDKKGYVDIDVNDLPKNSMIKVKCLCDYCGKIIDVQYSNYIKSTQKTISKTACSTCSPKKVAEGNLLKYGYENPGQFPNHNERTIETNLKKYGAEYYMQTDEYKERYKKTVSEKYGCDNISQNPMIREKIAESFYKNGTQKSSKQQRYICKLFDGILNYPIGRINADILLDNKIIIEYNGGGHVLNVKTGQISSEEQRKKELKRYYFLKKQGYKIININSIKDKLPSDDILYEMKNNAFELLNDKHCHWVEYDIDNNLIKSSLDKNGSYYNYGKLRIIKKEGTKC